jgi:CRP-like cAMP-binding protein
VYVVEEGEVDIYRTRSDGTEEALATVTAGGYFGELGPTLNLPRSASARAATQTRLTSYTIRHFRRRMPEAAVADA